MPSYNKQFGAIRGKVTIRTSVHPIGTGGTGAISTGITVNQYPNDGGFSQFKDSMYRADGGKQTWVYQFVSLL